MQGRGRRASDEPTSPAGKSRRRRTGSIVGLSVNQSRVGQADSDQGHMCRRLQVTDRRLRHQPSTRHRGGWNCAVRPALAGTHAVMLTSNDRWPIFTPTQAAIGNVPCELRLSMCLPTRLELRRNAAPRDGESTSLPPTAIVPTPRPPAGPPTARRAAQPVYAS
jgi:hypothetical protein